MTHAQDPDALFIRTARRAAAFRRSVGDRAQGAKISCAEALKLFEASLPETPTAAEAVIDELSERAEPGLTVPTGPRFFGWVIGASHPVGVAADWMAAAWGQNAAYAVTAPSAAAVEAVAARWLLELLDLPRESSVGFVTGATMANFTCLAAARSEVLRCAGWDCEADGLFGAPPVHVLIGQDAHPVVLSGLQLLGFGHERIVRVATDGMGRMRPEAFQDAAARLSGPMIVVVQVGQVNTGAIDPIGQVIPQARAKGAWVHVDGAFGLWARACPEIAPMTAGLEQADSWAADGHKWLQTPYDTGYAIVRHVEAHRRAMSVLASYLPLATESERDPSDYVPELSRRARGFATWAMIRHLGRSGIAEMVGRHCRIAKQMAERLAHEPGVQVLNDIALNQVLVRFGVDASLDQSNELTKEVIRRIQEDGICLAGGAMWRGQWVMRLSVISGATTEADAARAVDAILAAWRTTRQSAGSVA